MIVNRSTVVIAVILFVYLLVGKIFRTPYFISKTNIYKRLCMGMTLEEALEDLKKEQSER